MKNSVFDGRFPNMRVDPAWYEDKHPQEYMPNVEDPIALYRPSPEVIAAPSAPVLTASLQGGTTAQLTWTPAESGITEIASYSIFRGLDGALPTLLITCAVVRDFLGGIVSVQHCTTTPSIPVDDTSDQPRPGDSSGSVFDKLTNEDAPVTYLDAGLSSGHTYCYYIVANPMGNNQSVGQGPPSAPSNMACVTTTSVGGLVWTRRLSIGVEVFTVATHAGIALAVDSNFDVHKSTDGGHTWTTISNITGAPGGGNLIYNNGVWLFAAANFIARSSNDGATWALIDTGTTSAGFGVVGGNGANLLVFGTNVFNPNVGVNYSHSTDNGLTWTPADPFAGAVLYVVPPIWNGAQFVALVTNNSSVTKVATSSDGVSWTLQPAGNPVGDALQFNGTTYLAAAFTTTDQVVTAITPAALVTNPLVQVSLDTNGLSAVLAAGGLFFAFDFAGGVYNSTDGTAWAVGTLNMILNDNTDGPGAVAYDSVNNSFIAVGNLGSICTYP